MASVELELKEYILNFCKENNIPIDLRFESLGDDNRCYVDNKECVLDDYVLHWALDIEGMGQIITMTLYRIMKNCEHPINKIITYIKSIIHNGSWYEMLFDGTVIIND